VAQAQERLEQLPDGRLRLGLRKPGADGTSALLLQPLDFIARLVAAMLLPRFHVLRFHGLLAPHCALRSLVVPKPKVSAAKVELLPLAVVVPAESRTYRMVQGRCPLELLGGDHFWWTSACWAARSASVWCRRRGARA
jgi:hypothetical protein